MKSSPDLPDAVWQSLAGDAASLPAQAAAEARRAHARRIRERRLLASAMAVLVVSIFVWPTGRPKPTAHQQPAPVVSELREFAKVETVQQALAEPMPLPTGLDKEQRALVEAANGLPLLLVKNPQGKVTYVHVIAQ